MRLALDERDEELTAATRAACEMYQLIVARTLESRLTLQTQAWCQKHENIDRRRKREEAKRAALKAERQAALKKLTKKERKLLGLVGVVGVDL